MIWKGGIVKMDDNIIYPSIDGYYEKIIFYTSKGKEKVMLVDVMEPNLKKIKRNAMADVY